MKTFLTHALPNKAARTAASRGFTLVEIMIASAIFIVVIGAVLSTLILALKLHYAGNDYLDIGGQSRRLVDDMIETGTYSNDLTVLRDMSDQTVVTPGTRGDLLMFYTRTNDGNGNIDKFTCYYLTRTPPVSGLTGPVSVWRFTGTPGTLTPDAVTALNNYTRSTAVQVSGTVLSTSLPRTAVAPAVREGVFTNDGSRAVGNSATVLVNLPASLIARGPSLVARSNLTVAISPRH